MAVALGIIGGVVSALGAIQAANAQAAAANYNAKVQERNRLAILAQTDEQATDKARQNRRERSLIRARYGAAGIDMAGSPLDVMEDTAIEQELDIRRIRYAGELEAIQRKDQANLYRMEASAAKTAGMFSAVSNILGGFKSAYSSAGQTLMAA